jgi:hypothetical protein
MALFTHLAGRMASHRTVADLFRLSPPLTPDDRRTFLINPPAGFEDLAVAIAEQTAVVIAYKGGTGGLADRTHAPSDAGIQRPAVPDRLLPRLRDGADISAGPDSEVSCAGGLMPIDNCCCVRPLFKTAGLAMPGPSSMDL